MWLEFLVPNVVLVLFPDKTIRYCELTLEYTPSRGLFSSGVLLGWPVVNRFRVQHQHLNHKFTQSSTGTIHQEKNNFKPIINSHLIDSLDMMPNSKDQKMKNLVDIVASVMNRFRLQRCKEARLRYFWKGGSRSRTRGKIYAIEMTDQRSLR